MIEFCEACDWLVDEGGCGCQGRPLGPFVEAEKVNGEWVKKGRPIYFGCGDIPLKIGDRVRTPSGFEGVIHQFLSGTTKCVHVLTQPKEGGTYFPFECQKIIGETR